MKLFQKIAIGYALFVVAISLGMMIARYKWFPYGNIEAVINFVKGYEGDETSILEKLMSDSGGLPHRFIVPYSASDKAGMTEVQVPGLKARRAQPLMRLTQDAPRGLRVVFGAFDFEETMWGALLIDPDGKVIHTWRLSTDELPLSTESNFRKNMYGVDILRDGSIIFLMHEEGGGIVKVDYCGRTQWTIDGKFHHAMTLTGDGNFWTFEGMQTDFDHVLALFNAATGKLIRRIDMKDVRAANPDTHIFALGPGKNIPDAVHGNDIEPLPKRLAADFPQFAPGDLLISYKMINLLFILDPDTLKIKWWRIGPWDRQHDGDWNKGGYISVFSNNQREDIKYSNIVTINPRTFESNIPLKGAAYNFYSPYNGMHEVTSAGTLLVTSSRQGRVFEVNREGDVVFDFVNSFAANKDQALHVSNARFLGQNFFEFDKPPTCGNP